MTSNVFDQLDAQFPGWDQPSRESRRRTEPRWVQVCVCGHLQRAHSPDHGGTYPHTQQGQLIVEGCVGPSHGRRTKMEMVDSAAGTARLLATCPCREWRPVCEFDRARAAYFWTVMGEVHPLVMALRAFRTGQAKQVGEEQADEAVAARFRWIEGARRCAVCGADGSDVWPRYVTDVRDSELRCEEHR